MVTRCRVTRLSRQDHTDGAARTRPAGRRPLVPIAQRRREKVPHEHQTRREQPVEEHLKCRFRGSSYLRDAPFGGKDLVES
jgi:hypothetical protein